MRIERLLPLAVIAAAALAGCNSARSVSESGGSCTACHGGLDNQTGAPPYDLSGNRTGAAVGAHTAHLDAGVPCETCHVVPAIVNSPGHIDGDHRAEVNLGAAARRNLADPTYVPVPSPGKGGTCNGTYCHAPRDQYGVLLGGGENPNPVWTDSYAGTRCRACHGFPPPSHSASSVDCSSCHPDTVNADETIKVGGKHLNGAIDTAGGCTSCHGDSARVTSVDLVKAAPPRGTHNELLTTEPAVGAHQAHLFDGPLAKAVACQECHVVPADIDHASQPNTVVVFNGPLGTTGGTAPAYTGGTCNAVYCHGQGVSGGTNKTPRWIGGSAEAACGTCHGRPPPAPGHPQEDKTGAPITTTVQCSQCHPGTVNVDGSVFAANGLHVNGTKDVSVHGPIDGWVKPAGQVQPHGVAASFHDPAWPTGLDACRACHGADLNGGTVSSISCNSCHAGGSLQAPDASTAWQSDCTFCHGDPQRATSQAAPPVDTQGHSTSSDKGVGAHLKHLGVAPTGVTILPAGVACTECHTVPAALDHVNGQVAMTWGPTATKDGTFTPVWNGTTCANYCHGATLPASSPARPAVTWAPPTTESCAMCHEANPTTGQHPAVNNNHSAIICKTCHLTDYTTTPSANHVNKALDVQTASPVSWNPATRSCAAACHGGVSHPW